MIKHAATVVVSVVCLGFGLHGQQPPSPTNLGNDANGNPLRRALKTGHVSNYEESKVASAKDDRIAAVFSSCAGEMGSSLARRDWGETVDDMAQNFPWQFAGNFQKWVGRWNDMPVDAHMLIALSAPATPADWSAFLQFLAKYFKS